VKLILKYAFIVFAAFIIAGSIAYYSVSLFTQSADEIILPQLTGKNIIYVLETLTSMGLNAKLHGTQYDDTIPRYNIISQDPQPGATIKKGRDISIYISKGTKENNFPDLRQIPLSQALILLEKNEFKRGQISLTYSVKTQKDCVIAQYPEPFSNGLKGSLCHLLVSRGAAPLGMVMPDIKGLQIEKASAIIEKHSLGISKIISNKDLNQDSGVILSYTPEAGSHVTSATPIIIVVNSYTKHKQIDPDQLNGVILLTHSLGPGFLKQHVRVETDMFGPIMDLYNEYMKPGEDINILVPSGIKTRLDIFIDHRFEKTIIIDPWKKDNDTGDMILWESSPLQFYQPILPGLVKN
jgi:serine/threonine-protein kinase